MYDGKTCLVTGGAGFIGSHLCQHLLGLNANVVAVDNLSGGDAKNVPEGVTFCWESCEDDDGMRRVFDKFEPDYVWHLAAYAAEGLSHWIRRYNVTNNYLASVTMLNHALRTGVEHFVFTSSMAVYGAQEPPFTEEQEPSPEDPYAICKAAFERELAVAAMMWPDRFSYTVFRPHNVYGTRQNIYDGYRNVVGIFMRQNLVGQDHTIFGDGRQTRAFSDVSTILEPLAVAPFVEASHGLAFNVGGDVPYTILQLSGEVNIAMSKVGVGPVGKDFKPERFEVKHAHCDHSRRNHIFGPAHEVPIAEGLYAMAGWAKGYFDPEHGTAPMEYEIDVDLFEPWRQ